jgi:hypothetical protein
VLAGPQKAAVEDGTGDRRQPAALGGLELGQGRADPLGGPLQRRRALQVRVQDAAATDTPPDAPNELAPQGSTRFLDRRKR